MASLQDDTKQVEDVTPEITEKVITKEQEAVAQPPSESEKNHVVDVDDDDDKDELEDVTVPPEEKAESSDLDDEDRDMMEPSFLDKDPADDDLDDHEDDED